MKRKLLTIVPYLLISLAGIFLLTWKIGLYPLLWYDEGNRLNLVRTFVETGAYATYSSDGYQHFNAWVIASPLDVLSTSAAMLLLGKTVAYLRLAMIPFSILAMILIASLAVRLFGKPAGWIAALTVFAAPPLLGSGFMLMGRQNLIENTSFAILLLSLFLWFKTWDTRQMAWTWLGGILLGVGLISNFQMMLWVFPALFLIWLGRCIQDGKRSKREIIFILAAGLVIVCWYGLSMLLTPAKIRLVNEATLIESVTQHLFNGLSGKVLTTTATAMFGIMVVVSLATIMDLFQSPHKTWFEPTNQWKRATLGLSVLMCAAWFYFFSIGWPRYAYAGWMITLLLLGWWGYRIVMWFAKWLSNNNQQILDRLPGMMLAVQIVMTFAIYGYPLTKINGPVPVEQTAQFIDSRIPQEARIETSESELYALSSHREFHYPSYEYILDATKQIFFDRRSPQIPYSPVVSDPDYLITGALSDWLGLYWNSGLMETEFVKIAEFPPYQVFQRIR
jgi:4-amino-4-deoxy-L-arabinose transferase-like glycosyltransferase